MAIKTKSVQKKAVMLPYEAPRPTTRRRGDPDKLDLMARAADRAGLSYGYWMATASEAQKWEAVHGGKEKHR
jgi:hypothetical protein